LTREGLDRCACRREIGRYDVLRDRDEVGIPVGAPAVVSGGDAQ
jgi:hypothetical protein